MMQRTDSGLLVPRQRGIAVPGRDFPHPNEKRHASYISSGWNKRNFNLNYGAPESNSIAKYVFLLNQFDELSGNQIVAELGPNTLLTGTNNLSTTIKKWGDSSLHVIAGQPVMNLVSLLDTTNIIGKSWRFEFWVYWVTSVSGSLLPIALFTPATGLGARIGRRTSLGAYSFNVASSVAGSSGVAGAEVDRPPLGVWVHTAIEQQWGGLVKIFDSAKNGFVANLGTTIHTMAADCFGNLQLTSPLEYYVDSLFFRWFEPADEDQLYVVGGYTVPTGPFSLNA